MSTSNVRDKQPDSFTRFAFWDNMAQVYITLSRLIPQARSAQWPRSTTLLQLTKMRTCVLSTSTAP
eukprot:15814691-Heterocapsa_arctica.AAC.1